MRNTNAILLCQKKSIRCVNQFSFCLLNILVNIYKGTKIRAYNENLHANNSAISNKNVLIHLMQTMHIFHLHIIKTEEVLPTPPQTHPYLQKRIDRHKLKLLNYKWRQWYISRFITGGGQMRKGIFRVTKLLFIYASKRRLVFIIRLYITGNLFSILTHICF